MRAVWGGGGSGAARRSTKRSWGSSSTGRCRRAAGRENKRGANERQEEDFLLEATPRLLALSTMSCWKASLVEPMVAPALMYSSSCVQKR